LDELISQIKKDGRHKDYDCIIGVSGGVDSTYVAYLTKTLGLRPLAVHLDNGWNSELAVSNISETLTKLNIDLYTYVINWEEFKDLQLSFINASVVDIELTTDHAIFATLYKVANKHRIKYILQGVNIATEGFLPSNWIHNKFDWLNIKSIHSKFGKMPLKTFPHLSLIEYFFYNYLSGIKFVPILNYIPYSKEVAKKTIVSELNWRDYDGKHYESVFTRFYQAYILPKKFGIDKRKSHYSTLICAGEQSKEKVLELLKLPALDPDKLKLDKEFVIKKFNLTSEQFEQLMSQPVKRHRDYPSYMNYYYRLRPFYKSVKNLIGKP
jgi:N-acetyl sugar amidotransferase